MAGIEKVVDQLNFLIKASENYAQNDSWYFSNTGTSDPVVLCNRLESAVERAAWPGSSYMKQLDSARRLHQPARLLEVRHVALGLRDDLVAGWVETVVELVHADTYSDYLEMAEGLLAKGYKDAAAVIAGTSLEVHVRALCVKNGVTTAVAGKPKKADTMNADLKKAGVYDGLRQKQITAWMDLRNKAAHGNYSDYTKDDVRLLIDGVQSFMTNYPA
ncbi:HEPN domain-containing protein [Streptomyces sp. P11-1]|uniref:HEPN domain-containing protein n=1 Tax=Streptomyces sp. P11-1 TaxID=3423221 RepID=UPI003D2EE8E8